MNTLPPQSVRGAIRAYIERHAPALGAAVLECGSRLHEPEAWWTSARDLAAGEWIGCDIQPGENVDVVADLEQLPADWSARYTGVLCSEVLEHIRRPQQALQELNRVLKPGGLIIITTLTAFPLHDYPADYRRWTESGLFAELEDASFMNIKTARAGNVRFCLNDHGEPGRVTINCPIHVFATALKPC